MHLARVVVAPPGPSVPGPRCEAAEAPAAASLSRLILAFLLRTASMRQSRPRPPCPLCRPHPRASAGIAAPTPRTPQRCGFGGVARGHFGEGGFWATVRKREWHRSPNLARSISNMPRRGLERRACLKWARDLVIAASHRPAKGMGAWLWPPQNTCWRLSIAQFSTYP